MRPHNGRMRGNHSLTHALAVGATVAAVAVILALVAGVARAEQGLADIVADLPWWKAIAVAGIAVVLVLGVIQIVEAAVFGVRAVLRIVVAVVMFIAAAITSAFSHEAPTGWSYGFECCSSTDCRALAPMAVVGGWRVVMGMQWREQRP